jgi:alkylation response protein AidB-like acyl-CoA dehydrogenase
MMNDDTMNDAGQLMQWGFRFPAEVEGLRARVREFARAEIASVAARNDDEEHFPIETLRKMAGAGLLGVISPKELGGLGMSNVALGAVVEEIAKVDLSCAIICSMQNTLGNLLHGWGNELRASVNRAGDIVGLATSEPDSGSDISQIRTTAIKQGDHLVINGTKRHVSLVPGATALAVSATMEIEPGRSATTLVKVETNRPGVSWEAIPEMGQRAHQLAEVYFRDVRVPLSNVMGEEGKAMAMNFVRWNVSRAVSALISLGTATGALDLATEYAKKRVVYGKPIARFEAVQFPIVEQYTRVEAGRWLAYRALWGADNGVASAKEASMAKLYGARAAFEACDVALQTHGADGYTRDLPLERMLRDVRGMYFSGGTPQIHSINIGREIFGKGYAPHRD